LEDSISWVGKAERLASFLREDWEAQERLKTTERTLRRFKMVIFEIIGEIISPHPFQKKTQSAFQAWTGWV
jgi:hypothetical protein